MNGMRGYGPMEEMLQAMRDELTQAGFGQLRTSAEVDSALADGGGTALVVVNSVCGCAAGSARPGVVKSIAVGVAPERLLTVFAGQDREATSHFRTKYLPGQPTSSPSMALFRDGKLVWMLHRHQIEGRSPDAVSAALRGAYEQFCGVSAS
jgi:putative YphP/YqiW family bacilliredoxin